ncbi:hypothetical protein K0M31_013276 [Melipona bicolor]|uniref:Uncharacterized protein n=1 Tax=Melipona bicolor TaxID=60889 RepID=A0AA40FIF7_9HYME|nr:hypothetical protein K0M31_013276 [Melipona bicolor]
MERRSLQMDATFIDEKDLLRTEVDKKQDRQRERDSGQGNERTSRRRRTTGCPTRIALGLKEINEPNINQ